MKNPFILMSLAFAAAQASFREAMAQQATYEPKAAPTRSRIPGPKRPAGSKLARKALAGRCTLRGRRGLVGHLGRVSA